VAGITVEELVGDEEDRLKLRLISGEEGLGRKITISDINRPGLALAGYFDYFAWERIQVVGRTEMEYLKGLPENIWTKNLERLCSYDIPCFIIARDLDEPSLFRQITIKSRVPLLKSPLATTKLISDLSVYLDEKFAPRTSMHGVLVDVFGIGMLLLGKSGIGKSECALELVERGHRLVADDVVEIKLIAGKVLMGNKSPLIGHHMEIRGLGIINVRDLFGIRSIRERKHIEVAVLLEEWDSSMEPDRLGLDEETHEILGVSIPKVTIPVRPGRSIAVIVEAAAINHRSKLLGLNAPVEFSKRLLERIQGE